MPLRPSQLVSIAFWVCSEKKPSTQPVSLLVALPLPHRSSGPENTWLFAESAHTSVVLPGSRIENVLPDWVVFRCTGFGPLYAAVPSPFITRSIASITLPVRASTYTSCLAGEPAFVPLTRLSQASRGL